MKPFIIMMMAALLCQACSFSRKTSATASNSTASKKSIDKESTPLLDDNTFLLTETTTDETYGYTEKNPVNVGGVKAMSGPLNERRFLNALTGPGGETVSYYRRGSCCPFPSKNGFMGGGLLDHYRVTWEGKGDTVSIYINMYDPGKLKIPVGFKARQ